MALPGLMGSLQSGNLGHAIEGAERLLESAGDDARVHDLLSTALAMATNRERAAKHARIALDLNPDDSGLAKRAVSVLQRAGEYDTALAMVERAMYRSPGDLMLEKIRVNLLTDLGKNREAARAIKKLSKKLDMTQALEGFSVALLSARLVPSQFEACNVIADLERHISDESLPGAMRKAGAFELGRLLELQGEYERAFGSYRLGNELSGLEWDPDAHSARIDRLLTTAEQSSTVPDAGYRHPEISGKNLVFICGMMRSGSSLLEQIISQLDGVIAGDEQAAVLRMITQVESELNPDEDSAMLPMPVSMDRYTQEHMDRIARAGLERYAEIVAQQKVSAEQMVYVTDKQTEHSVILPLLPKLFPGCTIVYTARDAIDTCLSNFTTSFAQGHAQSSRLDWIGRFYVDHARMMSAWRKIESLRFHDVGYAELVREPERVTKRVAEILGLEWSESMLEFYKSKRTVATASQNQVRQPLYTSSVGRAARFGEMLDPLKAALSSV